MQVTRLCLKMLNFRIYCVLPEGVNLCCRSYIRRSVMERWWRINVAIWSPILSYLCYWKWTYFCSHLRTYLKHDIKYKHDKKENGSQQGATFHNFAISVRRFTCFRRFFRPSSGAQNCTYSVKYLSDQYLTLYVQFWAPDDGRKNRLKHVKKLWNVASCWLYCANILAVHGPMIVKKENVI